MMSNRPQLTGDLFDRNAAWNRAVDGMTRSSDRCERLAPGWKEAALESVRQYALAHETFLAEQARAFHNRKCEGDLRGWGAVMQQARELKFCRPDGYASANSSNRSPKVLWRSLIFRGGP